MRTPRKQQIQREYIQQCIDRSLSHNPSEKQYSNKRKYIRWFGQNEKYIGKVSLKTQYMHSHSK